MLTDTDHIDKSHGRILSSNHSCDLLRRDSARSWSSFFVRIHCLTKSEHTERTHRHADEEDNDDDCHLRHWFDHQQPHGHRSHSARMKPTPSKSFRLLQRLFSQGEAVPLTPLVPLFHPTPYRESFQIRKTTCTYIYIYISMCPMKCIRTWTYMDIQHSR